MMTLILTTMVALLSHQRHFLITLSIRRARRMATLALSFFQQASSLKWAWHLTSRSSDFTWEVQVSLKQSKKLLRTAPQPSLKLICRLQSLTRWETGSATEQAIYVITKSDYAPLAPAQSSLKNAVLSKLSTTPRSSLPNPSK